MAHSTPNLPLARFSVEQYHRMIESGAFTEHDQIELIEGWVTRKMAKGPAHEYATGRLDDFLRDHLPAGWHVRNQAPVTLATSEPEPDLAVARGTREAYRARHPGAGELALVIEVADTSLEVDRIKGPSYAVAQIPEYWIVNLRERCVEVHTDPTGDGYDSCTIYGENDHMGLVIEGVQLARLSISALLS